MEKYQRDLKLLKLLNKKSHFLFGARATGKSTLIKDQLSGAKVYDLLGGSVYRQFLRRPESLREELADFKGICVIDEIQKLPSLLDEVHWIIENLPIQFLLTGSSARKLKHGGANLLAGRAWWAQLFPLTSHEIHNFDLLTYLNRGGLPAIYQSKDFQKELASYVNLYIREEVQAEALARNVDSFSEFLDLVGISNGEEINFSRFASDCGVSPTAIKSYFRILEDTQVGFEVKAYTKSKKRKAISRSKFFLFDVGVASFIANRGEVKPRSELFGKALEHFIAMELRAALSYGDRQSELLYWRTTSQMEVDFVIPDQVAIEVKATHQVQEAHLKGLRALREEGSEDLKFIVISMDPKPRITKDNIYIFPVLDFLKKLWAGSLWK